MRSWYSESLSAPEESRAYIMGATVRDILDAAISGLCIVVIMWILTGARLW